MKNHFKLLIEDGRIIHTPKTLDTEKYLFKPLRDYWNCDYPCDVDKANKMPFDKFVELVNNSDIGIYLELSSFEQSNNAKITPKAYNKMDIVLDSTNLSNTKYIFTKKSLIEAIGVWAGRNFDIVYFRIGKGKDSNPVLFVHPADKTGIPNEVNNPTRIPHDD